jgi:tetratricopeptide (TPR) repeat protein
MKILLMLACVWAVPALAETQPTAPDTSNLAPLLKKEAQLVQTVRRYDLQEKALADWDTAMAKRLADAGEAALAKEKAQQAQKRYEQIQTMYEEILKHYPNNARALNYYGEILYDFGRDEDKALESWKMSSTLDPKLPEPLNNLGIHYCHVGSYEDGVRYLDQALKLDPDNPDFLFNIAQNYLIYNTQIGAIKKWSQEKVYHEAMKASKRAAELSPASYDLAEDYAVNFFAAERFNITPDWADAAAAWEKARELAIYPDRVFFTWLNEARAWKRGLNKEKALKCLLEARKLQPESEAVKTLTTEVESFTTVQHDAAGPNHPNKNHNDSEPKSKAVKERASGAKQK